MKDRFLLKPQLCLMKYQISKEVLFSHEWSLFAACSHECLCISWPIQKLPLMPVKPSHMTEVTCCSHCKIHEQTLRGDFEAVSDFAQRGISAAIAWRVLWCKLYHATHAAHESVDAYLKLLLLWIINGPWLIGERAFFCTSWKVSANEDMKSSWIKVRYTSEVF